MQNRILNILFWTVVISLTMFIGLLTFMFFEEWITVGVLGHMSDYPWGCVNETPWYYETPKTYSLTAFIEGLVFLTNFILVTIQIIKKNKKKIVYALLLFIGLFIAMMINATIQ